MIIFYHKHALVAVKNDYKNVIYEKHYHQYGGRDGIRTRNNKDNPVITRAENMVGNARQ